MELTKNPDDLFATEWPKIEKEITTMARKVFLPGYELDDLMQEFRMEAYIAAQIWDKEKASYSTLVWMRCFHIRDKLIQKYNTKKRDHTKEAYCPSDEMDWNIDEFGQILRDQVGNAGRYAQIMMLDTVDQIGKCVLVLQAAGYNINDTVEIISRDVDPGFDRKRFESVREGLRHNEEVLDLMS